VRDLFWFVSFDVQDFDIVKKYRWYISGTGYACHKFNNKNVKFHHLLMGKKDGLVTDHINRNKLDNRRKNLRFVTHKNNCRNNNVEGISWSKNRKKWIAQIGIDGGKKHLGSFELREDALKARRQGELKYWGDIKFYPT